MSSKSYVKYFVGILTTFILFHFITWNIFTKKIFDNKPGIYVGDLGRMSYSVNSLYPRKNESTLKYTHRVFNDYKQTDIITIGDSYSRGDVGGRNPYYQDFIATEYNLDVVNIIPSNRGFIETILILKNSGALDKIKPKSIILETSERSAIKRLSNPVNWDIEKDNEELFANPPEKFIPHIKNISFVNSNNYRALLYQFLYQYYDNAILSKVYKIKLSKNLFECKNEDTLLFYYKDLKGIEISNLNNVSLLNDNLNRLQYILKKQNIKLYFMPAVDKYNVYSKYIVSNKYKESNFFELLRLLPKKYSLIDTKLILQKLTDSNITNVYYPDDTHWSYKSSAEIVKHIKGL